MNILENYSPNDTQPISPRAYEDIPSAAYQTGQTGHVDLIREFEQSIIERQPASQDDFDEETDPLSQPTQVRAEPFPEEKRFQEPQTPAMTGQKRDRAGKAVSQRWSTPSLPRNPFANQKAGLQGVMNASQVFKATQYSSPLPQPLLSDATTERPSPILVEMQRTSTSETLSSPARLNNVVSPHTRYEPRDRYISVKESQARRQEIVQTLSDELTAKEASDEDFDSEGSVIRRRRIRQRQEQKARAELTAVGASRGIRTPRVGKQTQQKNRSEPIPIVQTGLINDAEEIMVSSDEAASVEDLTEQETERENGVEEILSDSSVNECAEDNKENIANFGVQVPRTTLKAKVRRKFAPVSQPTPSHRSTRQPTGNPPSIPSNAVTSAITFSSSSNAVQLPTTDEGSVAVADSQFSSTQRPTQLVVEVTSERRPSLDALKSSRDYVPTSQPLIQENAKLLRHSAEVLVHSRKKGEDPHSSSPPTLKGRPTIPQAEITHRDHARAVFLSPQHHASSSKSSVEDLTNRKNQAYTSPENGKARFRASMASSNKRDEETCKDEKIKSVIPDTESIFGARRSNNTNTSIRTIGTSFPSKSVRSHSHALSAAKSTSHQSTAFETAPSSLEHSPASKKNNKPLPRRATGPNEIEIHSQHEIHVHSKASGDNRTHQGALESSSPVAPYRPRRHAQRSKQVFVSSPESRVAGDATEDELALSTAPTSSPISSAPSVEDPTLCAVRGAPVFPPTNAVGNTEANRPGDYDDTTSRRETSIITKSLPNRVFAHFNGKLSAYYPATCMGIIGGEEPRYKVQFDDGGDDTVNAYGVKRLEFKPGDPVKIDAVHLRKHSYVVEAGENRIGVPLFPEGEELSRKQLQKQRSTHAQSTDIYGNTMVTLSLKPAGSKVDEKADEKLLVPIDRIYVTRSMWASYKDRTFSFTNTGVQKNPGPQTPAESGSNITTPTSRCARVKASVVAPLRQVQSFHSTQATLFSNMVFAITNVLSDEARKTTRQNIEAYGGQILDARFDDLFHVPDLDPFNSEEGPPSTTASGTFQLRKEALTIGFAGVIADKHCRMAKYIQALALGIPCLSRRWISDCVSMQQVLPWSPYLLAAGESSYLYDAVVSRTLPSLPPGNISLAAMINARPRLLADQTLLLIMSKREEEKMKHMPLVSHALGARKISRVQSAEEAAKAIAQAKIEGSGKWDWVYSHDDTEHVTDVLSGGVGKRGKRARKSEYVGDLRNLPRVVGNEFVIQSLVVGRLIS